MLNKSGHRTKNYIASHILTGDQFTDFKPIDRSNCVPAVRPVIRLRSPFVNVHDKDTGQTFVSFLVLRNPEGRHPSERY